MAGVYSHILNEDDDSREARRRRIEMRRLSRSFSGSSSESPLTQNLKEFGLTDVDRSGDKKLKLASTISNPLSTISPSSSSLCPASGLGLGQDQEPEPTSSAMPSTSRQNPVSAVTCYGTSSVSGRSRDMEDDFSVRLDLCRPVMCSYKPLHYFAVFDGHGGPHVAGRCRDYMHVFLEEELMMEMDGTASNNEEKWSEAIHKSFERMDVVALDTCSCGLSRTTCPCDLDEKKNEIIGSTAVISLLTPDQIVLANCGDSRAVLSRGGRAIPLSVDHKPDKPDELARIEAAGGQVIYLNGARVLGLLAMSRALGDRYLKPIVIAKPDITFTNRTSDDECLILASDGLWDVLSNDMACDLARRCLFEGNLYTNSQGNSNDQSGRCSVAAALLTRLALGRRSSDNISVIVIDLKGGR